MNAHIINCNENEFFNSFLPGGYLGVGIVIRELPHNNFPRLALQVIACMLI